MGLFNFNFGDETPSIQCKTPKEIDKQYRSYKTRRNNIKRELEQEDDFESMMKLHSKLYKLHIKIELLENILKIK